MKLSDAFIRRNKNGGNILRRYNGVAYFVDRKNEIWASNAAASK